MFLYKTASQLLFTTCFSYVLLMYMFICSSAFILQMIIALGIGVSPLTFNFN